MLVGTITSHEEREVAEDIVRNFAQDQNILYYECHIDTGSGIGEAFSVLIDKVMEKCHSTATEGTL